MATQVSDREIEEIGTDDPVLSVIVPCYNEHLAIEMTLNSLSEALRNTAGRFELIVVDDGSTDKSPTVLCRMKSQGSPIRVLTHPRNHGYGAALKTGIRAARAELVAIVDADGTYPNDRLLELWRAAEDADMVVGARNGSGVTYSKLRAIPKFFLRRYCSFIAGESIPDINSGFRVFRKDVLKRYLRILPDGFSFTTTITLAMLTNNHRVAYIPVGYRPRIGRSKIRPIRDTLNFIQLILRTGTYFAPLRVFMPVAFALGFGCMLSLAYDVFVLRNLTDKTLMLMLASVNAGMFALLADMISKRSGD